MGNEIVVNTLPILVSLIITSPVPATTSASLVSSFTYTTPHERVVWLVEKNETLEDIAKKYYGGKQYWTSLWNDNPEITNPKELEEGTKLKLRTIELNVTEELKTELARRQVKPRKQPVIVVASNYTLTPANEVVVSSYRTSGYDDVYKDAGAKYGVPWEILYGLHLTESGLRDGDISNHQGSGAQGPMQFMPGTWRAYEVDGNGDGTADINSAVDAIHTAANFIAKHGSVERGLQRYMGNTSGVLAAARSRGYTK